MTVATFHERAILAFEAATRAQLHLSNLRHTGEPLPVLGEAVAELEEALALARELLNEAARALQQS